MTRLAEGRTTHLEPAEIAVETLRLFDQGSDPSIRQLAGALQVTPSAIYHHFDSRAEIVQAAVDLVWQEVLDDLIERVGDPFEADPADAMVACGLALRQAMVEHCRIAPYMAATPLPSVLTAGGLSMMAAIFERFGLRGEDAAEAFHTYASLTFGTSLFAANRRIADQSLEGAPGTSVNHMDSGAIQFLAEAESEAETPSDETRDAIVGVMNISSTDPERDAQLFEAGLRRMIDSLSRSFAN